MNEFQGRWRTAAGSDLMRRSVAWLLGNAPIPADLGVHDGRVDLRGISLPTAALGDSFNVDGFIARQMSGTPTVAGQHWKSLDFSHARLQSVRFFNSRIEDCRFDGAVCDDWRLWNVATSETSFARADLSGSALGTWWEGHRNQWRDVVFERTNLKAALFDGSEMQSCRFMSSKMKAATFSRAILTDCVFVGLLDAVVFDERTVPDEPAPAPLTRVDFSAARFRDVIFRGCHFVDVQMPPDAGISVFANYPAVARRSIELAEPIPTKAARTLIAVLKNELQFPGDEDSEGVLNRQDWASWQSEELAELAESIHLQASRDVGLSTL